MFLVAVAVLLDAGISCGQQFHLQSLSFVLKNVQRESWRLSDGYENLTS
jgi:hypothetical protein